MTPAGPSLLLALLTALLGCPPALDDDTASDDDSVADDDTSADDDSLADDDTSGDDDSVTLDCEAPPMGQVWVCPLEDGFPQGEAVAGQWSAWGSGPADFTTTDGSVWTFDLGLPDDVFARAPSPLQWELVWLTLWGECGKGAGAVVMSMALPDDPDAVFLLVGSQPNWEQEGLFVGPPSVSESCAAMPHEWCSCAETCAVQSLEFRIEPLSRSWTLGQGQVSDDPPFHLAVWEAYDRIEMDCADITDTPRSWGFWLDVPDLRSP